MCVCLCALKMAAIQEDLAHVPQKLATCKLAPYLEAHEYVLFSGCACVCSSPAYNEEISNKLAVD